jgi:DNA-binding HxlR family transcriptional regulator
MTEVSAKVLTETLRGMERDGLVHREIYHVIPPRVEYSLTPMGKSVIKPLEDLCHWAKAHIDQRDAARKKFDGGSKTPKSPKKDLAAKRLAPNRREDVLTIR